MEKIGKPSPGVSIQKLKPKKQLLADIWGFEISAASLGEEKNLPWCLHHKNRRKTFALADSCTFEPMKTPSPAKCGIETPLCLIMKGMQTYIEWGQQWEVLERRDFVQIETEEAQLRQRIKPIKRGNAVAADGKCLKSKGKCGTLGLCGAGNWCGFRNPKTTNSHSAFGLIRYIRSEGFGMDNKSTQKMKKSGDRWNTWQLQTWGKQMHPLRIPPAHRDQKTLAGR